VFSERGLLPLVGQIYAAAANPDVWPAFLESYSTAVKAKFSVFVVHRPGNCAVHGVGIERSDLARYERHFESVDIRYQLGRHIIRPGLVHTGQMLCPDEVFGRSEIYHDFYRPLGAFHSLGTAVVKKAGLTAVLTTMRGQAAGTFSKEEREVLELLSPHLLCAIQLNQRIAALETRARISNDLLNQLPWGVILLDVHGAILLSNRLAEEILKQQDGLIATKEGLVTSGHDGQRLRQLILDVAATRMGEGGVPGRALQIERRTARRPLQVLVAPVSLESNLFAEERPAVVVFLNDPDRETEPREEALRRLFGLTKAETKVASLLLAGNSVDQCAELLGVSIHTARIHLKRVLSKTGTGRQAELMRLAMRVPPLPVGRTPGPRPTPPSA
jgi:DNA-binding CsgD family transcriptional regulator